MKRRFFAFVMLFSISLSAFADEGMWLPLLLGNKQADMQANGMKITAEDIYSANHSSLKDAVVLFGRGCTGEFVSPEGLLLTNHHCGYSYIVSHSTVEADYLTNGFWAEDKTKELPCKGLSVTLLVYMQDVTTEVLNGVGEVSEAERQKLIDQNMEKIKAEATKGTHYQAVIKPFYYGNQYFMYVNEVFTDVRLVGAPPSNIGKFGGDTDNWMWPRHTGDFSVFRVYASKDNKPADYNPDNIPYTPKKHLKINLSGAQEGDFTFVFGYPGTTKQFLTSDAVNFVETLEDPAKIKLRTARLDVYNRAMSSSPAQRLRYASDVASVANGWKKWQGEVRGLKRLNARDKKITLENKFSEWALGSEQTKSRYGRLLNEFSKTYAELEQPQLAYIYINEALLSSDLMETAFAAYRLVKASSDSEKSEETVTLLSQQLYESLKLLFENDYANHKAVDREIFIKTMTIYYNDFAKSYYPWLEQKIKSSKANGVEEYLAEVYDRSFLSNPKQTEKLLKDYKRKDFKKLEKDPAVGLFAAIFDEFNKSDRSKVAGLNDKLDSLYRVYVEGIMKMDTQREFYPDANLTLRVAYGNVKPYEPKDGVVYKPYSTIEGIMEKENPDVYDYVVEKRLKDLYLSKDYGRYANQKGELPVAFIASNHTTGGNSGSPVLDANGNLIGINFDRNWEGTMSDIMYDVSQCRNISLDIRYCLFIIDKFAGATHLINEMTIVK